MEQYELTPEEIIDIEKEFHFDMAVWWENATDAERYNLINSPEDLLSRNLKAQVAKVLRIQAESIPTDKRETVERLFENGLSCSDGSTHFLDENHKRYLIAELLSLLTPKVLEDEEMETIWQNALARYDLLHPKSANVYEREMSGLRAISRATVDKGKK